MRLVALAASVAVMLAVAPSAALTSTAGSPGAAVPTKYDVVARTSSTSVEADSGTVRIVGQVKPWAAGEKVQLLQKVAGSKRWTRTDSARLTRTSRFVLKDRPSRAGVRYYRVLKPASDGLRADRSTPLRVEVLRWEKVADLQAWAGCGIQAGASVQIGGTTYPSSLLLSDVATACMPYVQYDLAQRCRTLRATYGFVDGTWVEGGYGGATISGDDRLLEYYQLGSRTFVDQVLDITGVARLTIGLLVATSPPYPGGRVAVGTPEVLCLP